MNGKVFLRLIYNWPLYIEANIGLGFSDQMVSFLERNKHTVYHSAQLVILKGEELIIKYNTSKPFGATERYALLRMID